MLFPLNVEKNFNTISQKGKFSCSWKSPSLLSLAPLRDGASWEASSRGCFGIRPLHPNSPTNTSLFGIAVPVFDGDATISWQLMLPTGGDQYSRAPVDHEAVAAIE
jgi:hypothetical protein